MRAISLSLLLSTSSAAWAQGPAPIPSPAVEPAKPIQFETEQPEGFDDLLAARDQQLTLYIDGQPVGPVDVVMAPGEIRFASPVAIIRHLPELKDDGAVAAALTKPMPSNAGLSCSPAPTAGCGRLEPDVVGVILSRDAGRLDLFLAAPLRGPPRRHLADPMPGPPTFSGALGLNYTLSQRGIDYSVNPRFMLGLGRGHFAVDSHFSNRNSSLDRAYYRHVQNGSVLSAGLIQSSPFQFIYFDRLVGVSFASSRDTLIERGGVGDTPLIFDAPLAGRVEILRDGVLLDTQRITPGRVLLETAQLPGGAYPLTLKITDGSGTREETRFFVRAQGLPAYGEREFFFEAGWNTGFRGTDDRFLPDVNSLTARAGVNLRVAPQIGVSLRAEATDKRQLAEAGLTWINNDLRVAANLGGTADGDYAAAVNASGKIWKLNWSLDARRVKGGTGFGQRDFERGIGRSYDQASTFVSYNGNGFSLSSGLLWRRDPPGRASFTILPNARWTISQRQGRRFELEASGSYTQASWSARIGLRVSLYKGRSSTSVFAGTQGRGGNIATSFDPVGNADWSQSRDTGLGPLQLRAGVSHQSDRSSGRLGANLTTTHALLGIDAQIEEQLSNSSVYGRVDSSFGLAGGLFGFGAGGFSGSGIVVKAPGGDGSSTYTVRALGSGGRPIKGSGAVFVPVSPFSQGDIGINASGGSTAFETRNERAVFYPGTVRKLVRSASKVTAIFARLLDENGAPIADAIIRTKLAISDSDAEGRFQMEAETGDILSVERADGKVCGVTLPTKEGSALFLDLGDLKCVIVAKAE